ncbi:6-phosphogluconolactonase [Actinotalea sp.]|uniref:6-phosphogluconolactonase n=1 Tax=Actinotalea sp. TaxID=1872145 RepID=UPI0035656A0B
MNVPSVVVHPTAQVLAEATAARLLLRLMDLQSVRRPLHVVLTGGTVGIAVLARVDASPLRDAVDWTGVHLWWGDERFLPTGHPDRNETQARQALLDRLPVPADQVHPMPAADAAPDPETAATRYAAELATLAPQGAAVPRFDVVLLGVGPDGHLASLFPGRPALEVTDLMVAGVRDSPKPPPLRVTLTYPALAEAAELWLVAAGESKAEAVARALSGDDRHRTPSAGVRGRDRTRWLIDLAAAGRHTP